MISTEMVSLDQHIYEMEVKNGLLSISATCDSFLLTGSVEFNLLRSSLVVVGTMLPSSQSSALLVVSCRRAYVEFSRINKLLAQ